MLGKSLLALATSAFAVGAALGINCRGSGLCARNKGLLGQAQAQLRGMDQSQVFTDGQHVTCVQSTVTIGNPSLCIFYQRPTVDAGRVPTDPGNNVDNGELTTNMVTNTRRGRDMVDKVHVGKREDAVAQLGINCRGSSTCGVGGIGGIPRGTIEQVRNTVAGGPEGAWSNGQHIGCVAHATGSLYAFYQNIGSRTFNKGQSVAYLNQLLDHGCTVCGSVPTDPGNNVANGELTVNFVA